MPSQERAIWARWVDIKDIMIMLWDEKKMSRLGGKMSRRVLV